MNWKTSPEFNYYIKSFISLQPLLKCFELPAVQLFSVWTIHHFLFINREHIIYYFSHLIIPNFYLSFLSEAKVYFEMLVEINGNQILRTIYERSKNNENQTLISLCEQTIEIIENEYLDYIRLRVDEI